MAERHAGLEIPEGVSTHAPFVQILDPATGTGTFLVEVIDIIHKTMVEKWSKQGTAVYEIQQKWDDYVPRDLLPRLHGFELMMAPYAIAHMKIGLKLRETGYSFFSSERARVYLTNTLEEPKDFSDYFEQMAPALAHEAEAANKVKRSAPCTVVIGNPPYSVLAANLSPEVRRSVDPYRYLNGQPIRERSMLRFEMHLQDDYVKFVRFAQRRVDKTGGVMGLITNNGYFDNLTLGRETFRSSGVSEEVWCFHIGCYQVCEKWLKDRRERTLSNEDISHYQRVVVALNETIRLMAEIDAVIEEHGGWPLPGSQDALKPSEPDQLPFS